MPNTMKNAIIRKYNRKNPRPKARPKNDKLVYRFGIPSRVLRKIIAPRIAVKANNGGRFQPIQSYREEEHPLEGKERAV